MPCYAGNNIAMANPARLSFVDDDARIWFAEHAQHAVWAFADALKDDRTRLSTRDQARAHAARRGAAAHSGDRDRPKPAGATMNEPPDRQTSVREDDDG
jgi:hypothetical protein